MKDVIQYIKNLFSFLSRKPKTEDDKVLKRYDLLLFICAAFLIIYAGYFFLNVQQTAIDSKPNVVTIGLTENELHPLLTSGPNMGYGVATTPMTIVLKTNEFYVGEIVGVKYFGIYGIVREKILGIGGYTYEVRWRDSGHGLPKDIFHSWELYRPERGSVPTSILVP